MNQFTDYERQQLTNQTECYIHTHPRVDNYRFPHGGFSDDTDQTATINTATAVKMNTTDVDDGVDVVALTQITVSRRGIYNIQFSAQLVNTDTSEYNIDIWFAKNGSAIPNSNTVVTMPKKHGSGDGSLVAAWNLFVSLEKGEFVEIMWSTPSTFVSIQHIAAKTSPDRPATPSVIVTASFVSE